MTSRVYVVTDRSEDPPQHRLVRASGPSVALNHVASRMLASHLAPKDELVQLLTTGARVEDAGEQAQGELELPSNT
jgi:hypothetical protein